MNVLGFKIPLEFIMSGKKVEHVKIGSEKKSLGESLDKINEILDKQYKTCKPCDFEDLDENIRSERIDDYDANFFPDGDDPIVDDDVQLFHSFKYFINLNAIFYHWKVLSIVLLHIFQYKVL